MQRGYLTSVVCVGGLDFDILSNDTFKLFIVYEVALRLLTCMQKTFNGHFIMPDKQKEKELAELDRIMRLS